VSLRRFFTIAVLLIEARLRRIRDVLEAEAIAERTITGPAGAEEDR
jgi:hypothetical protein